MITIQRSAGYLIGLYWQGTDTEFAIGDDNKITDSVVFNLKPTVCKQARNFSGASGFKPDQDNTQRAKAMSHNQLAKIKVIC